MSINQQVLKSDANNIVQFIISHENFLHNIVFPQTKHKKPFETCHSMYSQNKKKKYSPISKMKVI